MVFFVTTVPLIQLKREFMPDHSFYFYVGVISLVLFVVKNIFMLIGLDDYFDSSDSFIAINVNSILVFLATFCFSQFSLLYEFGFNEFLSYIFSFFLAVINVIFMSILLSFMFKLNHEKSNSYDDLEIGQIGIAQTYIKKVDDPSVLFLAVFKDRTVRVKIDDDVFIKSGEEVFIKNVISNDFVIVGKLLN